MRIINLPALITIASEHIEKDVQRSIIDRISYDNTDQHWLFDGKRMTDREQVQLRTLFYQMDKALDDARSALGFC